MGFKGGGGNVGEKLGTFVVGNVHGEGLGLVTFHDSNSIMKNPVIVSHGDTMNNFY